MSDKIYTIEEIKEIKEIVKNVCPKFARAKSSTKRNTNKRISNIIAKIYGYFAIMEMQSIHFCLPI